MVGTFYKSIGLGLVVEAKILALLEGLLKAKALGLSNLLGKLSL